MENFLRSAIALLIVLGPLILVHEWGHFVVARWFGVRVDIFSIGFGPRLWGRKRGDTDYRISAIPLGGYVKMAGDNPAEERAGAPDEFLSKPRWQRALIALAGPVMNILVTVIIIYGLFVAVGDPHARYLDQPAEIAAVGRKSSAENSGVRAGDRIVDVNGVAVVTWGDALKRISALLPNNDLSLKYEREGSAFQVDVKAKAPLDVGDVLGYPLDPVFIGELAAGMPAAAAGLKEDDEIVAINDSPVFSWIQCVNAIRNSKGELLVFDVKRGGESLRVTVKPVLARGGSVWQVGMGPRQNLVYTRLGPGEAVGESIVRTKDYAVMIAGIVGQLITGKLSLREMSSIIIISREAGQAAKRGAAEVVFFMATISLNLGILNLLPIPILDGGHILMLTIEGIRRRDLSLAVKERFVQVGLVFLLVVFAIVMYNDVLKLQLFRR
ncbi:MAG: RIP metalloprotease RseP [Acidobacteria bacterium]|nr:RIP metalloprotease RseP [Acidobacteriota bacterium]MCL5286618.1 RIP metalloprotease RseP [Acidobacteriota bacterium]